eukprot:GHVU01048356.1.p1 GENE.GHVU01048356.1~~GHVU01048356.1.p1  ORF type:complete len:140 (+),score=19.38 GHVU01048356.1:1102-1521(+)
MDVCVCGCVCTQSDACVGMCPCRTQSASLPHVETGSGGGGGGVAPGKFSGRRAGCARLSANVDVIGNDHSSVRLMLLQLRRLKDVEIDISVCDIGCSLHAAAAATAAATAAASVRGAGPARVADRRYPSTIHQSLVFHM